MNRSLATLLVLLVATAGCTGSEPEATNAPTATKSATPIASQGPVVQVPVNESNGLQMWRIDPDNRTDSEVILAAHPTDPNTILVSWQVNIDTIWSARTSDAGQSWIVQEHRDPAIDGPVSGPAYTGQEAFDTTCAFGPDGTMYVFFGGQTSPAPGTTVAGGLTVSRLDGDTWSYHHIDEGASPWVWDAMHFAVSPDTGRLHAVAQSISSRTLGYYTSDDKGDTWSTIQVPFLAPDLPLSAPGTAQDAARDQAWFLPRVAAGPGTQVSITSKVLGAQAGMPRLVFSETDGDSFGRVEPPASEASPVDTGMPQPVNGPDLYVFADDDKLRAFERNDDGVWNVRMVRENAWGDLEGIEWTHNALDAQGRLWVLMATGSASTSTIRLWPENGEPMVLMESTQRPFAPNAGDEYGGIAVAADGTIWMAWGDGMADKGTMVVAHFVPVP